MRRVVDLSHPVAADMPTHPGVPAPRVWAYRTREEMASQFAPGVSFELTGVEMVTSVGTYVDAPAHRHEGAADLAALRLDRFADLPGRVVDVRGGEREVGPDAFAGLPLAGRAVLLMAGWDRLWGTPAYWEDAPYLTAEACRLLVASGAALVGVDFGNVDDRSDLARPAHTILLGAGLGLVENLRGLAVLPRDGFRFHAAAVPLRGGVAFPVRAYAVVEA